MARSNNKRSFIVAGALSALTVTAVSRANMVTYTQNLSTTNADFSTPFTLPQFNSSLGTLTGAQITYSATITAVEEILDFSGDAAAYSNATTTLPVLFTGPDGYNGSASASAGPFAGSIPTEAPVTITDNPGSPTSPAATVDNVAPTDLGDFIGAGNLSFTFASQPLTSGGSSDPADILSFGGGGSAGGAASIEYTYTAVPEPASVGVLAFGAMGLLGRRRRKSS